MTRGLGEMCEDDIEGVGSVYELLGRRFDFTLEDVNLPARGAF